MLDVALGIYFSELVIFHIERVMRKCNWRDVMAFHIVIGWTLSCLMLEGGCHAWRIPVTERTPCEIPHTRDTKIIFRGGAIRKNGLRILGGNGPK